MPYKDPEKLKEYQKEYDLKNKEKIKEYKKEYYQTHKKNYRISKWKSQGIIFHDFDLLYEMYLQTTHCDECNCLLTYDKTTTKTTKCVDHDHSITDNDNFRNILCNSCNAVRK